MGFLADLNENTSDRGLRIVLDDSVYSYLVGLGLASKYGGRSVQRGFQVTVVDAVTDRLIEEGESWQGAWCLFFDQNGELGWRLEDDRAKYLPAAKF